MKLLIVFAIFMMVSTVYSDSIEIDQNKIIVDHDQNLAVKEDAERPFEFDEKTLSVLINALYLRKHNKKDIQGSNSIVANKVLKFLHDCGLSVKVLVESLKEGTYHMYFTKESKELFQIFLDENNDVAEVVQKLFGGIDALFPF